MDTGNSAPPEASTPQTPPIGTQGKADYWKDARLEKTIQFQPDRRVKPPVLMFTPPHPKVQGEDDPGPPGPVRLLNARVYPAAEVAAAITKQTGVTVLIQGDLGREKIVVPVVAGSARELMDKMVEAFFPVRWFQAGEKWVLAFSIREAALTSMPAEQRNALHRRNNVELLRALSPAEWRKLRTTGTLEWHQMSPSVQRVLFAEAELYQFDPERGILNAYLPGASREGGFFMKLNSNSTNAILHIGHPAHTFGVGLPFLMDGKYIYGVAPPP